MLPMIVQGLADKAVDDTAIRIRSLDAQLWVSNEFPEEVEAWQHGQRRKRQTVRAYNYENRLSRSPWKNVRRGQRLRLWWKSRTKERRLLAEVEARSVTFIQMENAAGFLFIYPMVFSEGTGWVKGETMDSRQFAYDDGFDNVDACRDYFVPEVGATFKGVIIKW